MSSKQKCTLSMLSIHFCFTFNPSETIWLVSPSPLTAPSYFTPSTSSELAAATNKITHWLSYIGTAELKTKAQSIGPIYHWWTDSLAVCCAVNVETKQGTGLEVVVVVLFRMFLAVGIKYLVWNNKHAHFQHCCEVLHGDKRQKVNQSKAMQHKTGLDECTVIKLVCQCLSQHFG